MTTNCRCTTKRCRARRTLKRPPEWYIRRPTCSQCGGNLHPDPATRRDTRKRTCKCDGLSFPHHKGTSVWCESHPIGPADEDFEERYNYR